MARTVLITSSDTGSIANNDNIAIAGTYQLSSPVEAQRQAAAAIAGHFCFLGAQSNGGNGLVLRFRKGGANGFQTCLVANNWAETALSDNVSAGDLYDIQGQGGVGGVALYTARQVFSANSGHSTYHIGILDVASVNGTTSYFTPAGYGFANNSSDESRNQIEMQVAGTIGNLQAYVRDNNIINDTVISVNVNGVPRINLTLTALTAGVLFQNNVSTWPVVAGDLVGFQVVAGADSGHNIFINFGGFTFTATSGSTSGIYGTTNFNFTNFPDIRYFPIAGHAGTGTSFINRVNCRTGFPATLLNSRFHVSSNAKTTDSFIRLYKNSIATTFFATIPAGFTGMCRSAGGLFNSVAASDDLAFGFEASSLGIVAIDTFGVDVTDDGGGTACLGPPSSGNSQVYLLGA